MRVVKSISLFFMCALLFFSTGYLMAYLQYGFGAEKNNNRQEITDSAEGDLTAEGNLTAEGKITAEEKFTSEENPQSRVAIWETDPVQEVSLNSEVLCADTEYILEDMDVLKGTVVEVKDRIPEKYIGMNRESFLISMDQYMLSPPLSERERGFVGLEVLSFSRERVVVQRNYRYIQPGSCFYLAVEDHEVVALLDDKKTVYIHTGLMAENLPEEVQMQLTDMIYVENEGKLYDFLEAYSS